MVEDTCSSNHYSVGENKAADDQTNSTYSSLKNSRFTIKAVIADNSHATQVTANDSKQISEEIYLLQTKASQLCCFKVNPPSLCIPALCYSFLLNIKWRSDVKSSFLNMKDPPLLGLAS